MIRRCFKSAAARLGVPLQRLVRAYWLRIYTAHALQGVVSNPELLAWAKEQATQHSNGDVPDNLAKLAVIYAKETLSRTEKWGADRSNAELSR